MRNAIYYVLFAITFLASAFAANQYGHSAEGYPNIPNAISAVAIVIAFFWVAWLSSLRHPTRGANCRSSSGLVDVA